MIVFVALSMWITFHQYAPFKERIPTKNATGDKELVAAPPGGYFRQLSDIDPSYYGFQKIYHETTTQLGPPLFPADIDVAGESVRYSKLAYLHQQFQQEVETGCGRRYYVDYLFGHQLNLTRIVFRTSSQIIYLLFCVKFGFSGKVSLRNGLTNLAKF